MSLRRYHKRWIRTLIVCCGEGNCAACVAQLVSLAVQWQVQARVARYNYSTPGNCTPGHHENACMQVDATGRDSMVAGGNILDAQG